MEYRRAYETISKALWRYAKEHDDAYVRLMMAIREVDRAVAQDGLSLPPIKLADTPKPTDNYKK